MAEDQKYGALVPICDVFQEEVPLDPASRTRRYEVWGGAEQWKGSLLSQVNGLYSPELLLTAGWISQISAPMSLAQEGDLRKCREGDVEVQCCVLPGS